MKSFKHALVIPLLMTLSLNAPLAIAAEACSSFTANGIKNWYPFVYRDKKNELTGSLPDAAKLALDRIGLTMDIQQDLPWKRILHQLETGELDLVLGAYWNKERAKNFHYSELLGKDEIRVFVKKGNEFPLNSFEDLIGRIGLKLLGGSYGDEFDEFAADRLDFNEIPKSDQMIRMLDRGRSDYGILGYVEGLKHIKNLGIEGHIVALPWPILSNGIYILMSRTAACAHRIDDLNAAFRDLQKEGLLEKLNAKHITRSTNGQLE
ncbi:MAG: transporter substrate-binding domain-containing protein [Sneathiella sp.]